jgi:hypothetical protein
MRSASGMRATDSARGTSRTAATSCSNVGPVGSGGHGGPTSYVVLTKLPGRSGQNEARRANGSPSGAACPTCWPVTKPARQWTSARRSRSSQSDVRCAATKGTSTADGTPTARGVRLRRPSRRGVKPKRGARRSRTRRPYLALVSGDPSDRGVDTDGPQMALGRNGSRLEAPETAMFCALRGLFS